MAYSPAIVPNQIDRVLSEYMARELRRIGVEINGLAVQISEIDTTISGSATLALTNTFITVTDETATLANSRRLVAGANVSLNYSTSHQVIINVAQPTVPPDLQSLTFITSSDETARAPLSKRIVAGSGIAISISAQVAISATGGGGGGVTIDEVRAALDADAEFREEVIVNYWPGIVTNQQSLSHTVSAAVRVTNGLAFQECLDFCVGNRKRFRFVRGTIEIDLAGGVILRPVGVDNITGEIVAAGTAGSTTINPTGFTWDATLSSEIHQFATNTPILTLIPTSGVSGQFGIDFYGCTLHYGQDEGANTSSNAFVCGPMWLCRIGGLRISNTITNNRSYRGFYVPQTEFWFSNHVYDVKVFRSTQSLMAIQSVGTGNLFNNIYLSGVTTTSTAGSVANPFLYSHPTSGQFHGNVFNQFNIEWCQSNKLIEVQNARGMVFNGVHLEQNRLSGSNGCLVRNIISDITFNGLMVLDNRYESGTVSGVAPAWFTFFQDGSITIQNMGFRLNTSSFMNVNVFMVHQDNGLANTPARIHIENLRMQDTGGAVRRFLKVDSDDMDTDFGELAMIACGEVHIGEPMTHLERAEFSLAASTVFYGAQLKEAFIKAPASLSVTLNIQLSRYMGPPTARGHLIPIERGCRATIRRSSGTSPLPFTISNLEEGSVVTASLTAGTSLRLVFDGARWTTAAQGESAVVRYATAGGTSDHDQVVLVNAAAAQREFSLPALASCLGRRLTIKKVDDSTNVVVVDASGTETIDGANARTLSSQYQFITIIGGATDWHIIGR
jgi:hypothetical protein